MKLIVQPRDGVEPFVKAINKAKKSVEIFIFRFDRAEIQRVLFDAVQRGVAVQALIAFTNRGGEKTLRQLETEFLAAGITVARTAGDLVRYHGKMMVIDRKELHLLAFNFTHADMDHSRSFGLIARNAKLVQDALRLFECDTKRQEYSPGDSNLIVSPVNARKALASFIRGAKKQLLIYDPKISDRAMLRLLQDRVNAGVQVRIIGCVAGNRLPTRELARMRLHTRTIVRDGRQAFLGSQSLRQVELDSRRELGVIVHDARVVGSLLKTFREDWRAAEPTNAGAKDAPELPVQQTAKKLAKVVAKSLPVKPMVKQVAQAIRENGNAELDRTDVEDTVKSAVKHTVKKAVKKATAEAVKDSFEAALEQANAKAG